MLSWQVGRVKIARIVEMDLPVPAKVIPLATPFLQHLGAAGCAVDAAEAHERFCDPHAIDGTGQVSVS
jgi:hypothetical protein